MTTGDSGGPHRRAAPADAVPDPSAPPQRPWYGAARDERGSDIRPSLDDDRISR